MTGLHVPPSLLQLRRLRPAQTPQAGLGPASAASSEGSFAWRGLALPSTLPEATWRDTKTSRCQRCLPQPLPSLSVHMHTPIMLASTPNIELWATSSSGSGERGEKPMHVHERTETRTRGGDHTSQIGPSRPTSAQSNNKSGAKALRTIRVPKGAVRGRKKGAQDGGGRVSHGRIGHLSRDQPANRRRHGRGCTERG